MIGSLIAYIMIINTAAYVLSADIGWSLYSENHPNIALAESLDGFFFTKMYTSAKRLM